MGKTQDVEATNLFKVTFQSNAKLEAHKRQPCPGGGINARTHPHGLFKTPMHPEYEAVA